MASLGSLVIELAANTARLQSDMGKAVGIVESGARKMKSVFATLGVVGGGGFLGAVIGNAAKEAIKFGDDINKAAVKAGIGGRAMSELAYAAKLADIDIASLSNAIKKMQVALSQAGSGAKEPTEALAALGLSISDLQKQKPEDQFELLGDRISKLADPADRARAAVELFGKAGADLLPLFAQGASGIQKAREEAEKLGISLGDGQIKALSDADESIKRLDASWQGFAATLTAKVAPALTAILDSLTQGPTQTLKDFATFATFPNAASKTPFEKMGENLHPELGGRGRPAVVPGFSKTLPQSDADKQLDKLVDQFSKASDDINAQMGTFVQSELEDSNAAWAEQMIAWQDFEDARVEAEKETAQAISKMRDEQNAKLTEGAQIIKDSFLNAFDDMVHGGKLKVDELLKYILAEFSKRALSNLLDKALGSVGGTQGSTGTGSGFWSAIASVFGGARASGGPVSAGKSYLVGERGAEIFRPSVPGAIVPNGGGGVSVQSVINIDARGATTESAKLLPAYAKQISEATEARIVERLRRKHYGRI